MISKTLIKTVLATVVVLAVINRVQALAPVKAAIQG